jgi:hypothetical protein
MSQMHHGLLLRLSGLAVANFAEQADQPDRDSQEAQDDPNQEYVPLAAAIIQTPKPTMPTEMRYANAVSMAVPMSAARFGEQSIASPIKPLP